MSHATCMCCQPSDTARARICGRRHRPTAGSGGGASCAAITISRSIEGQRQPHRKPHRGSRRGCCPEGGLRGMQFARRPLSPHPASPRHYALAAPPRYASGFGAPHAPITHGTHTSPFPYAMVARRRRCAALATRTPTRLAVRGARHMRSAGAAGNRLAPAGAHTGHTHPHAGTHPRPSAHQADT